MSPRILLVEDEPSLAFNLQLNLEAEGYTVVHAKDGREAINFFNEQSPFALIILDVMLPEKNGIEVAKEVRVKDQKTAILMLTALASDQDRLTGLETGVDDYVSKPFKLQELLLRVKRMVERSQYFTNQSPTNIIDASGFKLDLANLKITSELGVAHSLTKLEALMLREFLVHTGEALTRDYLLDKVWGVRGNIETRTVDNFVMRLRKILEVDANNPKILVSVRGVGYRFEDSLKQV